MGKRRFLCFRRANTSRRRPKKSLVIRRSLSEVSEANSAISGRNGKKKAGVVRLWLRFDRTGQSEPVECDKSMIVRRYSIPPRDLRILGPIFSHSSNILAREKAMVVNLEFIKAIVTAEEVLLLDPLKQEVLPFVDQLRVQLLQRCLQKVQGEGQAQNKELQLSTTGKSLPVPEAVEGLQCELPFEFQVLEIALEIVCTYLDSNVADLERDAYPILDELARNVTSQNLEHVRSLKSNLTCLLARVQKVRDEIEHLLDDNEDMAQLYLTRKCNQQSEAMLGLSDSNGTGCPRLPPLSYKRTGSILSSSDSYGQDVEDLEMLLEAYFMQLNGTRNKILSVREYIDDTEDYVNIQLDNQRNKLLQLQLTLNIGSLAISVECYITGVFGMNMPCHVYEIDDLFNSFVMWTNAACVVLFLIGLGYARWKKLLGS